MASVAVVTVYTPRPNHEKWRDYLPALWLQKRTAEHFGARHVVISDAELPSLDVLNVQLPQSLMHAIIAGQIAYLEQWDNSCHVILCDADVLINRDPAAAFDGLYDVGITWRPVPPLNNGVIYITAGAKDAALTFFRAALSFCTEHWGGDQEAITQAATPIPALPGVRGFRSGARIGFLSMLSHGCVPEKEGKAHHGNPFVLHFKGEERKAWMETYARMYILHD